MRIDSHISSPFGRQPLMSAEKEEMSVSQIEKGQLQLWRTDRLLWQYREIQRLKTELRKAKQGVRPVCSGQSRQMSMVESIANVVVGFVVSLLANITILPLFGYSPGLVEATAIGAAFTAISLIRSYLMRRLFNWIGVKHALASKGRFGTSSSRW